MSFTVRFVSLPEAMKKATGTPDLGRMRVPYEVTSEIESEGVRVIPDAGPAHLAPSGHVAFLHRVLPRHPVGAPHSSYAGITRRLASLPDIDARDPATDLFGDGAREDFRAWVHRAREALALPLEVTLSRLPGVALSEEEKVAVARSVYAETSGIYAWDCLGARLDEAEATKARAVEEEKARREREEAAAKEPNRDPLDAQELVGISIEDGAPSEMILPYLARCTKEELERIAVERRGGSLVFVFPKSVLQGVKLRPGTLGKTAVTVLPGTEVIRVPLKELQEKALNLNVFQAGWFLEARGVPARTLSRGDLFDPRSPEGEWRSRLCVQKMKERAEALAGETHRPEKLAFEEGVRGLRLHPDVVRAIYTDVVLPVWRAKHPDGVESKTVDVYFTESGSRVPESEVRFVPGGVAHTHAGRPYRVTGKSNFITGPRAYDGGTFMDQTETKEFLVTRTETEHVPRPGKPLPISGERYVQLAREALEGKAPWVDVDELYRAPDPKTWAKILASFGHERDAWREVIRGVISDKEHVTSAEIEEEIVDAGLFSGTFGNEEHNLVKELAAGLGYEKKQKRFGANPERVYVKRTP